MAYEAAMPYTRSHVPFLVVSLLIPVLVAAGLAVLPGPRKAEGGERSCPQCGTPASGTAAAAGEAYADPAREPRVPGPEKR